MSPTVFRDGPFRYYFFSREESRRHVHVMGSDGEAKVWLEPSVELAGSTGLSGSELRQILATVKEHENEIREHWNRHFGG